MKRLMVPLYFVLGLLVVPRIVGAVELTGEVVTEAGQGLPARVTVYNAQTRQSAITYTTPLGKFSLEAPDGAARVWASHGPEWSIAEQNVAEDGPKELRFVLRRLVDMPARGYYGADMHMHSTASDGKQSPTEVAYACQAEGLQVAALTDHWQVRGHAEWLAQKTAGFLPLGGQENSTGMGHIVGVNTTEGIQRPDPISAAGILDIFRQIHAQGGFAILAHPNVPGMNYQAPEVTGYDAMEIMNGSIAPYGPVFDMLQARTSWHCMLSQGCRVPVVGDSDNHDVLNGTGRKVLLGPTELQKIDRRLALLSRLLDYEKTIAPWAWKTHSGTYRTYLQLEQITPEAVQAAVKAGNGFVTDGPLLLATLDGRGPGADIVVGDRGSVTLKAEVLANRPLDKLVVVVNGTPAATVQTNAAEMQVTVPVKAGDWVTAELYGEWPEFATTNAWYVK